VATSLCSSQRSCTSRMLDVSRVLSSRSSASMSSGVTKSASLSAMRLRRAMWPIERIVVPPILRTLSAISSVVAKICSPCSSSHQTVVAKMRTGDVPVEVLRFEENRSVWQAERFAVMSDRERPCRSPPRQLLDLERICARCFARAGITSHPLRNASRSALIVSACVVGMPWGKSL